MDLSVSIIRITACKIVDHDGIRGHIIGKGFKGCWGKKQQEQNISECLKYKKTLKIKHVRDPQCFWQLLSIESLQSQMNILRMHFSHVCNKQHQWWLPEAHWLWCQTTVLWIAVVCLFCPDRNTNGVIWKMKILLKIFLLSFHSSANIYQISISLGGVLC